MKRKLKAGKSVKGTPPITKFFKRSTDIKAKPLTAVVAIVDISPSKSLAKAQRYKSNTNIKSVAEIESGVQVNKNKQSTRLSESNKAILDTNLLNSKNENDLVQSAENFVNRECKENGLVDSSHKETLQKGAKKCLFNQSELNHSTEENVSPLRKDKDCVLYEKETEKESNVSLNSEREIDSGSLNKVIEDSKLRTSECKKDSESKRKLSDKADQDQVVCNSHNTEQHSPVTSEESLEKESCFACERKVILPTEDRNTENDYPEDKKSIPSLTENAPCKETVRLLSIDNSCSSLFGANEKKAVSLSSMDVSMEGTKTSDTTETIDCSESQKDVSDSSDIKTDNETFSCQQQSDSETKKTNEEMDSEVGNIAEDPVNDNVSNSESNEYSRQPSSDSNTDGGTNTEDQSDSDKCDDDSSDEELFNPVAFLCDNRIKPDVRTPEKATTPITGSPLTPISPYVAQAKEAAVRLKYSLDKLLSEKPKQVEKDKQLARLQLAMQQAIETGRNPGKADDAATEHQDDEKALLPIHQKELEKYKSTDKGFTEETYGVNLFSGLREPVKYENGCSQPFVEIADLDEFTKFLYQRSDVEIRELLCCDWITHKYLIHPCPPAAVQWLFHILCYHLDNHTIKASYNALWSILNVGDNKEKRKELSWIPSVQDVMKVFKNYGANLTSLLINVCESIDIGENMKSFGRDDEYTDRNNEQECTFFPLVNFTRFIQFLTLCLDRYPQSYSTKDLEHLVLLLYCISLDTRLEICQHDIKTCLQAMYSAVGPRHWIEEAIKMSSVIYRIETHHRNTLRVVQLQPYSNRGRDVKRLAALKTLASLLVNKTITDVKRFIQSDPDVNKDMEITNTLEMFTRLETLLHEVNVNDDTDYYQLYTMIELLDIVVGAEHLQPREKVIVERITKKLRSLHSDIKDPRAMFISRTKVKDLMLRTMTKFAYMVQGKKGFEPQKSITKFFVEGKSDLHIETLKDTEIVEENEEELGSQESQASSFILDPLSQTNEHSDTESLPDGQDFLA